MSERKYTVTDRDINLFTSSLRGLSDVMTTHQVEDGTNYEKSIGFAFGQGRSLNIRLEGTYAGRIDGRNAYDIEVTLEPVGIKMTDDIQNRIAGAIQDCFQGKLEAMTK